MADPNRTEFTFNLEMAAGYKQRVVDADSFTIQEPWLIFHRRPPQGGSAEYWRVNLQHVISMETRRNG